MVFTNMLIRMDIIFIYMLIIFFIVLDNYIKGCSYFMGECFVVNTLFVLYELKKGIVFNLFPLKV